MLFRYSLNSAFFHLKQMKKTSTNVKLERQLVKKEQKMCSSSFNDTAYKIQGNNIYNHNI